MFVGTVTKFTNAWQVELVPENSIQEDVAKALKTLTLSAIDADVSFVWLSWPYHEINHGREIYRVLEEFNDKVLKNNLYLKRRTRWGKIPTKLVHADKAQMAVLYIGG